MMEPDETAKMLLEVLEQTQDRDFVQHLIASDVGDQSSAVDWLAVLDAAFKLRARRARGRILH
jgi:hypothetical protein